MSKGVEIQVKDGQKFVETRMPSQEAFWYMHKGERLYIDGQPGYYTITERYFVRTEGDISIFIRLDTSS
jgi:hypothetical protein